MEITTVLKYAFILYVIVSIISTLRKKGVIKNSFETYASLRFHHFGKALLTLAGVAVTISLTLAVLPGTSWGWFQVLSSGESSNVFAAGDSSSKVGSLIVLGLFLVLMLALPQLARIEEEIFREGAENGSWVRNLTISALFGFIHPLLMGVPIAAGFGLTFAGFMFTHYYLKAYDANYTKLAPGLAASRSDDLFSDLPASSRTGYGVGNTITIGHSILTKPIAKASTEESTRVHLAYNSLIFSAVILTTIFSLFV